MELILKVRNEVLNGKDISFEDALLLTQVPDIEIPYLAATANEVRVAITEDKRLAELFVETPEKERMVGDIHLGKVAKVMPGIRAAFIDIGLEQDAFLHFSDIGNAFSEYTSLIGDDDLDVDTDDGDDEGLMNDRDIGC